MQVELRELQQRLAITTLFVTHDQEEALTLADRIAVMDKGRIIQAGPARAVYERPRTRFVTDFLGEANIFSGRVVRSDDKGVTIAINGEDTIDAPPQTGLMDGAAIDCAVRPEHVRLLLEPPTAPISLPATVQHVAYRGASVDVHLTLRAGTPFIVFAQSGLLPVVPQAGQGVFLTWEPVHTLVLEKSNGE
jgi:ABC-type Fe3+/spermidine/putrescine transport system ATPase subunit